MRMNADSPRAARRVPWGVLTVLLLTLSSPGLANDDLWSARFDRIHPYIRYYDYSWGVTSVVDFDGSVIVAGEFQHVGGLAVHQVARWDGVTWHAMGAGVDVLSPLLAVYRGDLYCAGRQRSARHFLLLRWDGQAWQSIPTPLDGTGWQASMRVHDDLLVVSGDFGDTSDPQLRGVAAWDGTAWKALGQGLPARAEGLGTYDGRLVAGGPFGVAVFDGQSWAPLGSNPGIVPAALAEYAGDLYAAGWSGQVPTLGTVQRWDGSAWNSVGSTDPQCAPLSPCLDQVEVLFVFADELIMGGHFDGVDGVLSRRLIAWDGTSWHTLGGSLHGRDSDIEGYYSVQSLTARDGRLWIAGHFHGAGPLAAPNLVAWDGQEFVHATDPGDGLGDSRRSGIHVNVMVADGDGVLVGGDFDNAGPVATGPLARWDGHRWSAVAPPLEGLVFDDIRFTEPLVYAVTRTTQGLVVGGSFRFAGDVAARNIALWDGSQWHALGSITSTVGAILEYEGELLSVASESGLAYLVAWTGSGWEPRGGGISFGANAGTVNALVQYQGQLVAAGQFDAIGGTPMSHLAVWKDGAWQSFAGGCDGAVSEVLIDGDDLYVTGWFQHVGSTPARRVARWDGVAWHPLGGGLNGTGYALAEFSDRLIAGGAFTEAGGALANRIALWDGQRWSALGSGVDQPILAVSYLSGNVVAGGWFSYAGGKRSWRFASYDLGGVVPSLVPRLWRTGDTAGVHLAWSLEGAGEVLWVRIERERGASWMPVVEWHEPTTSGTWTDAEARHQRFRYRLVAAVGGSQVVSEPVTVDLSAGVGTVTRFEVLPNPAHSTARVLLHLRQTQPVELDVFDLAGRRVRSWRRILSAGESSIVWDGRDGRGVPVAGGTYLVQLRTGNDVARSRVVLFR